MPAVKKTTKKNTLDQIAKIQAVKVIQPDPFGGDATTGILRFADFAQTQPGIRSLYKAMTGGGNSLCPKTHPDIVPLDVLPIAFDKLVKDESKGIAFVLGAVQRTSKAAKKLTAKMRAELAVPKINEYNTANAAELTALFNEYKDAKAAWRKAQDNMSKRQADVVKIGGFANGMDAQLILPDGETSARFYVAPDAWTKRKRNQNSKRNWLAQPEYTYTGKEKMDDNEYTATLVYSGVDNATGRGDWECKITLASDASTEFFGAGKTAHASFVAALRDARKHVGCKPIVTKDGKPGRLTVDTPSHFGIPQAK